MMDVFGISMGTTMPGMEALIEGLSKPLPSYDELEQTRREALLEMKELKLRTDLENFLSNEPDPDVAKSAKESTETAIKKLHERFENHTGEFATTDKGQKEDATNKTDGGVGALEEFIIAQAALYYEYAYADPIVVTDLSGSEEAAVRKYLNAKAKLPQQLLGRLEEVTRDYLRNLQVKAREENQK